MSTLQTGAAIGCCVASRPWALGPQPISSSGPGTDLFLTMVFAIAGFTMLASSDMSVRGMPFCYTQQTCSGEGSPASACLRSFPWTVFAYQLVWRLAGCQDERLAI